MKTNKLLQLIQQKNTKRSGGALPLPKAQQGLNFLQPNSSKLKEGYAAPSKYPSTELATSIGGENGEPAYLVPSFKYGHPLANPQDEFYNTGDYLGGPFKTWQEADKWDREIRHPYVERGQPIPSPLKWWGEGYKKGGSLPKAQDGLYARALEQYNTLKSGPAEAWNGDPANLTPEGNLNLCLDCINIDWENEQDVRDANRLIEEGYSMGTHESHDAYMNALKKFNLQEPVYNSKKISESTIPENRYGGPSNRYQFGGGSIQQQLINQALGQNNPASVRDQVASTAYPQVSQAIIKKKQNDIEQSDIKKYGSLEKAAQAKAIKNSVAAQKESKIYANKAGYGDYEFYNPQQYEYRDDKTVAPEGSILANMQEDLNAYNEFMANTTENMKLRQGALAGMGPITAVASDVLINGPIQSALNITNTLAGNRPLRGDEDFVGLFADAFNAMPVFSSLRKGARAFNEASMLAREATFSPTFGIMPGAMGEGLESSSRFLKETPISIPGGIKKGADDVIHANLTNEGIIRMEEADLPITDIMLGNTAIPLDKQGIKFVKDAMDRDPVLRKEIATIVRDLNKNYNLTLDLNKINSLEELEKVKKSALDFLHSSDPKAVNARQLISERLASPGHEAARADMNQRLIKKAGTPGTQTVVTFPNEKVVYEGRTGSGGSNAVSFSSTEPGVNSILEISGPSSQPNLLNHFLFVSRISPYTGELAQLKAIANPTATELARIAELEGYIKKSLMASGSMFKVGTQNAPRGLHITEGSMSSDSYPLLWGLGKGSGGKKSPWKLVEPIEYPATLQQHWVGDHNFRVQSQLAAEVANKNTTLPQVLPYAVPNTMGFAEGVGGRPARAEALGIRLQGRHLTDADEVALSVNTQNSLFETANRTLDSQLKDGHISQSFYDDNVVKWYANPLDETDMTLTTVAPAIEADFLENLPFEKRIRFAPAETPNDSFKSIRVFKDQRGTNFKWLTETDYDDSPYKYLTVHPNDYIRRNNSWPEIMLRQPIPLFRKEWKKGGLVRAQNGMNLPYYSDKTGNIPAVRESTSTPWSPSKLYNPPPAKGPTIGQQFFTSVGAGAIPYFGEAYDFANLLNSMNEGESYDAVINGIGLMLPFVSGQAINIGGEYLKNKVMEWEADREKRLDKEYKENYKKKEKTTSSKPTTSKKVSPGITSELNSVDNILKTQKKNIFSFEKGGTVRTNLNAQQQYFQLLINQKNKK